MRAFWSIYGRGASGVLAAAGVALCVAGCSSTMSRFDFPSFNLTDNATTDTRSRSEFDLVSAGPSGVGLRERRSLTRQSPAA